MRSTDAVFVCAHGAGGHKDDRGMLRLAEALGPHIEVVRFDFPYRAAGRARPDPMPLLKEAIAAAAAPVREGRKLIIGGRSMGGRAASMLAADGFACEALLLFAYPLHPARRPDKLRDAHLAQIRVPVLCFNGTRDALCTRELMDAAVSKLANWQMHWLQGADHLFHVLKSSGRTDAQVDQEVGQVSERWLFQIRKSGSEP